MVGLNDKLRKLRKKNKLSQKDVATFLGISESAYGYYEQGRNEPSLQTIKKLAKKFDVSIAYLLGEIEDDATCRDMVHDPKANEFIKDFLNATREEQEELKQYWDFVKERKQRKKHTDTK